MTTKTQGAAPGAAGELDRLYDYAEIAELAHVTERQVRRWIEDGNLDYVQLPRGRRVTARQYADFVNSRVVGGRT
jgi:predicted site-specific integrase-resolvase